MTLDPIVFNFKHRHVSPALRRIPVWAYVAWSTGGDIKKLETVRACSYNKNSLGSIVFELY